jgi:hypothetical protein
VYDPNFMFMPTIVGIVSATTRPPISAARSEARSWCGMRSGSRASTLSTFQFNGRCATRDICAMRSISSSLNPLRHPSVMNSSVVPGQRLTTSHRASISSSCAAREGTG